MRRTAALWAGAVLLAATALLVGCGGSDSTSGVGPVTFSDGSPPGPRVITINGNEVEADETLVGMKDSGSVAAVRGNVTVLVNKYRLGRVAYYAPSQEASRVYFLTTSDSQDLSSLVSSLKSEPTIEYAEFNGIAHTASQATAFSLVPTLPKDPGALMTPGTISQLSHRILQSQAASTAAKIAVRLQPE